MRTSAHSLLMVCVTKKTFNCHQTILLAEGGVWGQDYVLSSLVRRPLHVHEKNQEGLVDFDDIMDVVCDDTINHWNE